MVMVATSKLVTVRRSPLAACSVAQALGVEEKLVALARLTAGEAKPDDLATLDDDWALENRASVREELGKVKEAHEDKQRAEQLRSNKK